MSKVNPSKNPSLDSEEQEIEDHLDEWVSVDNLEEEKYKLKMAVQNTLKKEKRQHEKKKKLFEKYAMST